MKHFVILQDRSCTSNGPTSTAAVYVLDFHFNAEFFLQTTNSRKLVFCHLLCFRPSLAEEGGFMCKTPAIADIVILVDGSWSIGRINFRLVRTFLENLVRAFTVEFDKTRIGEQALVSVCPVVHFTLQCPLTFQLRTF